MQSQTNANMKVPGMYAVPAAIPDDPQPISDSQEELKKILQQFSLNGIDELLANVTIHEGKKNFLVFRQNKYINIPTEKIAFFYIKYEGCALMCFDKQEYFVKLSLEQVQNLLPLNLFFRLNRQYLINFNAVKEVEHYRARKLLINPVIPVKEQLLVPKRKVSEFLHWLDNR